MARRATSLGPKPSLFVAFVLFFLLLFFCGFKGQVKGPKGPPHLALYPPYFYFVPLLSLFLKERNYPKKGHFCFFWVSPFVFPLPFLASPFSLYLSLSLSSFFSFLLVFLFCFLLVPCFCLFLYLFFFFAFVSWKEQHQIFYYKVFFAIDPFSFLVSCLVFSLKSLFLIFVFPDFKLCFCSIWMFLVFKMTSLNTIFWSRGGLQQNVKSYCFSCAFFLANFGWCSKRP